MTTKIISFLGTSVKPTKYNYKEQIYEGSLFQIALRQFVEFDEMLVFVTKEAHKIAYPALEELNDPRIKPIDIRTGRTSEGLWEIFRVVVESVAEGDRVIFDITHGLRSIPFLTFLVAAYLRSAKNIKIEAVLYGAFDLGQGGPAPVIDLSEFVSLLDWLTATERFTQTGDGRPLAQLLRQAGHFEHPQRQTLIAAEQLAQDAGKRIALAAGRIEEVSTSLLTNLILKAEIASHHLNIDLQKAEADLIAKAPPYRLVAESIRNSYLPFANAKPMRNVVEDLRLQLAMIRWYLTNGQIPQAATLMREWVVTALGYKFGLNSHQILAHKSERKAIEETLGWAANAHHSQMDTLTEKATNNYNTQFSELSNATDIAKFWNELTQFRNLINHGVMRNSWREESEKIIKGLKQSQKGKTVYNLYARLEHLAETFIPNPKSEIGN